MSAHTIHHVTAVTAKIGENMRYYTQVLGLRLVKRSVNQDDVSAYHLFYADEVGSPGTDMTFFDWPMIGANQPGLATIALTSFRVAGSSVDYWMERLQAAGSTPVRGADERGRETIQFADPEGQRLELVADDGMPGKSVPWTAVVPAPHALRGILGVDLASARPDSTRAVLTDVLGFASSGGDVYEALDGDSYGQIRLVTPAEQKIGRVGAGGVHHVAFKVKDDDELLRLEGIVEKGGLRTSGFVDRFYFHSVYFREPGGILFELATEGPGFASDEDVTSLGQRLALPPFLEPDRARIEAGLRPLPELI